MNYGLAKQEKVRGSLECFQICRRIFCNEHNGFMGGEGRGCPEVERGFHVAKNELIQGTLGCRKRCGRFVRCVEMRLRSDLGNYQLFKPESPVY